MPFKIALSINRAKLRYLRLSEIVAECSGSLKTSKPERMGYVMGQRQNRTKLLVAVVDRFSRRYPHVYDARQLRGDGVVHAILFAVSSDSLKQHVCKQY